MKTIKQMILYMTSKQASRWILHSIGILLIGVLLMANRPIWYSIWLTGWVIIRPFLYGFIIAFVCNPAIHFLERFIPYRKIAIAIIYTSIIAFIILLLVLIIPMIYTSSLAFLPAFSNGLQDIQWFVAKNFHYDISSLITAIKNVSNHIFQDSRLISTTLDVLNQTITLCMNLILYLILALYSSANYPKIRHTVKRITYMIHPTMPCYLKQIEHSLMQYTKAFMIGALIQGIMTSIVFLLIDHPHWLLLGLLSCVSSVVPYIGPTFINALGLITTLSIGMNKTYLLCALIVIQSIIMTYIITPRMYAAQIDLSIMGVLFGLLTGATLLGTWGIIIAMPVLVTGKIIYHVYLENALHKKNL